jgi:hypothetical protein
LRCFVNLVPAPDDNTAQPRRGRRGRTPAAGRKAPVSGLQSRAAGLIVEIQEANARRLADAKARAAAIVAEAERINATFLKLAEEQATLLLNAMPPARRGAAAEPTPLGAANPIHLADEKRAEPIHLVDEKPADELHETRVVPPGDLSRFAGSIDGGVDLIAGPFARFSQLASFSRSVRELPGVISLDTRQFLKGAVYLRLRYEDPIPLSVRLAELSEFRPTIIEASPTRVELRVNPADPDVLEAVGHAA